MAPKADEFPVGRRRRIPQIPAGDSSGNFQGLKSDGGIPLELTRRLRSLDTAKEAKSDENVQKNKGFHEKRAEEEKRKIRKSIQEKGESKEEVSDFCQSEILSNASFVRGQKNHRGAAAVTNTEKITTNLGWVKLKNARKNAIKYGNYLKA